MRKMSTILLLPFGAINTGQKRDAIRLSAGLAYKGIHASKDNWCTFPMKGKAGGPGGYLSLMKCRVLNTMDLKSSSPTTTIITNSRSTLFLMAIILDRTEGMDVPKLLSPSWVIHPQDEVGCSAAGVLSNMSSP